MQADDADQRGLASVALDLYEQAVSFWRGECLSDVVYEDWAQPARTRLTDRFVGAALRAAELNLAARNLRSAQSHARRALTADEWCEPAHRILIAAALVRGDRGGAARALSECETMLDSLGVRPDPQTQMLRRHVLAAAPMPSHDIPRLPPPPLAARPAGLEPLTLR